MLGGPDKEKQEKETPAPEPNFPSGGIVVKNHYPFTPISKWQALLDRWPEIEKEMRRSFFLFHNI